MTENGRRVVVTGLGAVTPLGKDVAALWEGACAGRSGIGRITRFDPSCFASQIAGEAREFDPEEYFDRKELRKTDRFAQFGVAASLQAVQDARLDPKSVDSERVGVVIGSGIGGMETLEQQHTISMERGPARISPYFITMMIINMASGLVAIRLGFKGPNAATVSACSSGAQALGECFNIVRRGDADVMIGGGSEACITHMGVGGFCSMRALSTRNDDPERASRPFDRDRDGFVVAEGAGIAVLESLDHALARGARIYAEFAGYGLTGDAFHQTAPAPGGDGAARAMQMAMGHGNLKAQDIDYINAHGTSTELNDKVETAAIKTVLGDRAYEVPISSTKSVTGHLLGAAGGVELAVTALAIHHGRVPPTANLENPDPECDLDYVPGNSARELPVRAALTNSLGFGGHNISLALKAYK
ncbi:MAG: beta-ketoacyl-ACP synthase II [Candidatus Eisenbacteria sp.]|nr:beta-ketoacyl-ACP synthase II [Candidatus Eisenbacteria bacterium]